MNLITELEPFLELGTVPSITLLRDLFKESDHRFDKSLYMDISTRRISRVIDALVHGHSQDLAFSGTTLCDIHPKLKEKAETFYNFCKTNIELADTRCSWLDSNPNMQLTLDVDKSELPTKSLQQLFAFTNYNLFLYAFHTENNDDENAKYFNAYLKGYIVFSANTKIDHNRLQKDLPTFPLIFSTSKDLIKTAQESISKISNQGSNIPVVFVEAYDLLEKIDLTILIERPCILYFADFNDLWHSQAFEELHPILLSETTAVLIGDQYLHSNFFEPIQSVESADFYPITLTDHPSYNERDVAITECIQNIYDANSVNIEESEEANLLLGIGTHLRIDIESKRYGPVYAPGLIKKWGTTDWLSRYKGKLPVERNTYPSTEDIFTVLKEKILPNIEKRELNKKCPIRIAHIVPQIVDNKHAPSLLVRTLVGLSDREMFETFVLSQEIHLLRMENYPTDKMHSHHSLHRAPETFKEWDKTGVLYNACNSQGDLIDTAINTMQMISKHKIDIILVHGDDPVNCMVGKSSDAPLKVFVQHAGLVIEPEFDLVISSVPGTAEANKEKAKECHVSIKDLPYGVDSRADWSGDPLDLKLPEGSKVMTTVSNHLETRVTGTFIEAIACILEICPNTFYMPIGEVKDEDAFLKRFEKYGVRNRVMCLGSQQNPSHLCRSMHLYLNEFPFGGGLSILDGMAAGLPVITMYEPTGPMQAQNGGNYIGVDHAITSLLPEDYVALAASLLTDDGKYEQWKTQALNRYEQFYTKGYVAAFEELIKEQIDLAQ